MTGKAIREALEPCPFCGASAQVVGGKDPFEHYVFGVECSVCPAGMTDFDELHDHGHAARQTEIVAAWNRRARTGAGVKADSEEQIARAILPAVWQMFDESGGRLNPSAEADRKGSLAQARRVLSCLSTHTATGAGPVAGDFVLVPREPTEAMLKAAVETCGMPWLDAIPPHEDADDFILRQAFRAMLAAAPSTSSPQNGDAGAGPVGEAVADEGWQPIETAPTGGKFGCFLMLAFGPQGDQTVSEGMHFQGRFYAASVFYTGGPHDTKQFTFREHEVKPTHWRHTLVAPGAAHPVEPGEVERDEAPQTDGGFLTKGERAAIDKLGEATALRRELAETRGLIRDAIGLVPLAHQNWHTERAALTGDAQEANR